MSDHARTKSGPYHSLSRAWEKAKKRSTCKVRRVHGKKVVKAALVEYSEAA